MNNVTVIKYADDTCIIGCTANESDSSAYYGVLVDNELRFEEHVQNTVTKASQRIHIVRTFLHKSTKSLSAMFFIKVLPYLL